MTETMGKNHSTNKERSFVARRKHAKRMNHQLAMNAWIQKKKDAWRAYWCGKTMKPEIFE